MSNITVSPGFQLNMDENGNIKQLDSYWSKLTAKSSDPDNFSTALIYSDNISTTYSIDVSGSIAYNKKSDGLTARIEDLSLLAQGQEVLSIEGATASVLEAHRLPLGLFLTGDDTINGSLYSDTLQGLSGNDLLFGDLGNDFLNGGMGIDQAYFNSSQDQSQVRFVGTSVVITGPDGVDELVSVENLLFSDGSSYNDVLVDDGFYAFNHPEVVMAGWNVNLYYNILGWREGNDPNPYFDTSAYLARYSDVAAAGINPLQHYNEHGWKEGRDPSGSFDTGAYLAANPDVAAAGVNPLAHYIQYGIYEGRSNFADGIIG